MCVYKTWYRYRYAVFRIRILENVLDPDPGGM